MIDGFKLRVNDYPTIQKLFNNPKLDFKSEVSHITGEVSNLYRASTKVYGLNTLTNLRSKLCSSVAVYPFIILGYPITRICLFQGLLKHLEH
jgi:hypothetical protein